MAGDNLADGSVSGARERVCAIVPTFNRAEFLTDCLQSLLSQTLLPDDILVVDDGSTDATGAVVARFGTRIRYLHQTNRGKACALNLALARTDAEMVWIVDDDDIVAPDALERLASALAANPQAGIAFGDFNRFTLTPTAAPVAFGGAFDADRFPVDQLLQCSVFQPGMLVRRACYDATGPFDETLVRSQDYDMLLRLSRRFAATHVPHIVFHQRQHRGDRGTAAMRIPGADIWNRQITFDATVLQKVRADADLNAFLPWSRRQSDLSPDRQVEALLTRAAALAKRHVWDAAIEDIVAALALTRSFDIPTTPIWIQALFSHRFWTNEEPWSAPDTVVATLKSQPATPLVDALLGQLGWAYLIRSGAELRFGRIGAATTYLKRYRNITTAGQSLGHARRAARRLIGRATA